MKPYTVLFFLACLIFTNIMHAQTDTTITSLRGMEDQNGVTHLIYQIHYRHLGTDLDFVRSDYYILNTATNETKLLFNDYRNINNAANPDSILYSNWVSSFVFFNNDPSKFIVTNNYTSIDARCEIVRYDMGEVFASPGYFLRGLKISGIDTNRVFAIYDNVLMESTDGGYTWPGWTDPSLSVLPFYFLSFSSKDDSVMFGIDNGQHLVKSTDEGKTCFEVDELWSWSESTKFYYDADQNHIYALTSGLLTSSDNKGESGTWNHINVLDGYYHIIPSIIELDELNSGTIFIASGREVFVSYNFGNSFEKLTTFNDVITGLYKKPGENILFISFVNRIEEYNFSTARRIKNFSITKSLELYPLNKGNKWYYFYEGCSYGDPGYSWNCYSGYDVLTVTGDTVLSNGISYKIISPVNRYSDIKLQRVDSLNGVVYEKSENYENETVLYNLLSISGDSYEIPSIGEFNDVIISDTLLWNRKRQVKSFYFSSLYISNQAFAQGIGLIYQHDEYDFGYTNHYLQGCIIDGNLYGDTTTVDIEPNINEIPSDFYLFQNYPNPFNPITKIKYTIPITVGDAKFASLTKVMLCVYDVLGRKVAMLVNEYKPAGTYEVEFDGSNQSSGVYFYRLQSGDFVETKKFILMK